MTVYFYTALEVKSIALHKLGVENPHITTSFTPVVGKLPKMKSKHFLLPWDLCVAKVTDIKYWEKADVTVALVTAPSAPIHNKKMMELGLTYEHEFIPHITLCKGNAVAKYEGLIGTYCDIIDVYCGHIIRNDKPEVSGLDTYPLNKLVQCVPNPDVQDVPGFIEPWISDKKE